VHFQVSKFMVAVPNIVYGTMIVRLDSHVTKYGVIYSPGHAEPPSPPASGVRHVPKPRLNGYST